MRGDTKRGEGREQAREARGSERRGEKRERSNEEARRNPPAASRGGGGGSVPCVHTSERGRIIPPCVHTPSLIERSGKKSLRFFLNGQSPAENEPHKEMEATLGLRGRVCEFS